MAASRLHAADTANTKVRFAVCGLGRGMGHVAALLQCPDAEIAYVCDLDEGRVAKAVALITDKTGKAPKTAADFRRILEDKDVDAMTFALPNHWHAPATILACKAGKHVYVEKPGSHNAFESFLMVEAARKYQRHVQMGNQRRSYPAAAEAIQKLREGAIGKITFARSNYTSSRKAIGEGALAPTSKIDLNVWQGPAPLRDDVAKYVHYDWHWRWNWGGGELANNGPHGLDLLRWALGVDYPVRVTANGGRYHFNDTQETPDSIVVAYDFGHCGASWDGSSCIPRANEKPPFAQIYGDGGVMDIAGGSSYTIYDLKGKEMSKGKSPAGDQFHFQNFIDAIHGKAKLNSEIEEGQKSTMLCHLGNIAYRTGQTVHFDPKTKRIIGLPEAQQFWKREYREGWEPKV